MEARDYLHLHRRSKPACLKGKLAKEFHILSMSTRIENIPPFVIAQKYVGVSVRKHVLHPALHTDSLFRVSH